MAIVISVNEQNFEDEVINHQDTVLVDFYTPTCPPCKMMVPVLDQLAEELSGTVKVVKVDASENHSLVETYQVNSVPTFLLIKGGATKKTKTGVILPAQLKSWIEV